MLNQDQALYFTIALGIVTLLLLASNSRWHLLQGTVFILVTGGITYAKWTDNPYAAAAVGIAAAYVATYLALWLIEPPAGPPPSPPTGRTDRRTRKAVTRRRHA